MINKKYIGILLAVSMIAQLTACDNKNDNAVIRTGTLSEQETTEAETAEEEETEAAVTAADGEKLGMTMSLDDSGELIINRTSRESVPMGEEGTWTIFVYLCGTDLESSDGMATANIAEMIEGSKGTDVKYVVQTGGTYEWKEGTISNDEIQRYVIQNGDKELVDSQPDAPMSDESTLESFLTWGVENYAAAKMGVVFWNHGSGSVSGVCFDEKADPDSLKLSEIDTAFSAVSANMTDKFEFVGFDACLMSTVEFANVLATYSRYMTASQEMIFGWDFKAIGDFLCNNPLADGGELGKVICDSYCEYIEYILEDERTITISCIDLSKIDDVMVSLNAYSRNLYEATQEVPVLSEFTREVKRADNFGGNNDTEGYTNMVDLAGIAEAGIEYADGAEEVIKAIDNAVYYKRNGIDHENACGLSAYFPLNFNGGDELKIYGGIAVNPYYLSLIDRTAYYITGGDAGTYNNDGILEMWSDSENGCHFDEEYFDKYGYIEISEDSPYISFWEEPKLFDDGTFGFSLTDDSLEYAESVQAAVFSPSDDEEDLICYGISTDINADWETGVFLDNFDGCWFSLPDGQNLCVYIEEEGYGYDIYTSPVNLNGEDTNLRIRHDYMEGTITIEGAWDGVDENGMVSREIKKIKAGDTIVPLYNATSMSDDSEINYVGDEYVFDGEPTIIYDALPDGDYYYSFIIYDVYGDYKSTDIVIFSIENGEIFYYDE